jgi:hypothetical protein
MRKYILLFLFISCFSVCYSQLVKGTVLDEKTKTSIPYASVYFNGTFAGTVSDGKGYFELNRSEHLSMPLIISAIGYYSSILADFSSAEPIKIYLKPKEYALKEAVIKSKSLAKLRKRYMRLFKKEFLGSTDNALKCKIMNEKDITFNYHADKDTLKAFTSKPLLIENMSLGYKITYYLDKFEYYRKNGGMFFIGNIVFKENEVDGDHLKEYAERRKNAYMGSRMHFFRSLSLNDSIISGFTIMDSTFKNLSLKDIVVIDHKGKRYLNYPAGLTINSSAGTSYVTFLNNYVFFDKNGYFDGSGLNWTGYMGEQRIADWLPYEYTIK